MNNVSPGSVIIKKSGNEWLLFSDPVEIVNVKSISEVTGAIEKIEQLVKSGFYAAGFCSYEAAPAFDSALKVHHLNDFPLVWFGIYRIPKVINLPYGTDTHCSECSDINWQSGITREEYLSAIHKIKEYIQCGDTYQVNFTFRMKSRCNFNAWNYFQRIVNEHPVPFASYIETENQSLLSFSPELFFQLKNGVIICRPMKGTAPRGMSIDKDNEIARELQLSEKNRAENIMIVDMVRNDLGKIAQQSTVKVDSFFDIERYDTVHQMTSTVSAKTSSSYVQIFRALFPCASITGAPKIRSCQIINELETEPRKVYCGAIGYMSPGSEARFSVPIRTLIVDKISNIAEYSVGSGIVADSDPQSEYDECFTKAQIVTKKNVPFSLIETILWEPLSGFFLPEYHIERLTKSASYFEWSISREIIEKYLEKISFGDSRDQKIRLLYNRNSELSHSKTPVNDNRLPLRVKLADECIDSNNVFLYHKTTNRSQVDNRHPDHDKFDDVILFNERGEITEMTIGNIVLELDGEFITPPISSGLLGGVFRRKLLEDQVIKEKVVLIDDLQKAAKLFRINSVRKWERCELVL